MRRIFPSGVIVVLLLGFLLTPSTSGPQSVDPPRSAGRTATLLPDGRWFLLGGEGPNGPLGTAAIWDPRTQLATPLASPLQEPRAWHTATMLPDGSILIFGGVGSDGKLVEAAEFFDPGTQSFNLVPLAGLTARAGHTATLLTDGGVLIVGGIASDGTVLADAELWDSRTSLFESVPGQLSTARHNHEAMLLSDGTILVRGGIDASGNHLGDGERYDPASGLFTPSSPTPPPAPSSPRLEASVPADGSADVPLDRWIALRFSAPLRVETVNAHAVTLTGPNGSEEVTVVPAEGGILAFVTPEATLLPGAPYTLSLSGLTDTASVPLPFTQVSFTTKPLAQEKSSGAPAGPSTATAPKADEDEDEDEEWIPDARNLHGDLTIRRGPSPWEALPPLQADPGVTALAGQVLRLNGQPLASVTLRIGDRSAQTDDTGRFLLTALPAGRQPLLIDGRTASRPGRTYGIFGPGVDITAGQTTVLPFTIWLSRLDTAHAVTIPSPTTTEVVVTTPRIPGLEVRVPAGTVIRNVDGEVVTTLSITAIPLDRAPMPGPPGAGFPVLFTLQPGVSQVDGPGIRVIFPNLTGLPVGFRVEYWRPTPEKGWLIYGQGTVTPDGKRIVPDPGVVLPVLSCSAIENPGNAAGNGPTAGGPRGGEPVDLGTGLFVAEKTDLLLPDVVPIVLTRTYRPSDTRSRPFGLGTTHPYELFLVGDQAAYSYAELILPDGGRIRYTRISAGTGYTDAVMEHTATPTRFYKSLLFWNSQVSRWDLKLRDGTLYRFIVYLTPEIVRLEAIIDRAGNQLTVQRDSTQRITKIASPNGRWVEFTYGDGARIATAKDTLGRVVSYTYDATGRLVRVTDPAGGVTEYTYDDTDPTDAMRKTRMLTLKDARGIVFLTNAYDANGRVTQQTQADGTTYQFAYTLDGTGKVIQTDVTDPRGGVERVTFNGSGYPLTDTRALGQPVQQATTSERQAGTNFVTAQIDPLGRRTEYTYDAMGNVTSVTRLAGTGGAVTTSYTYESTFSRITSVTDPLNHSTTFAYDAEGNPTTITNALGQATTLTYNAAGQALSVTDPLGHTMQFEYQLGDLTAVTDPLGNRTTRGLDTAGRLLSLANPLGLRTQYDYDVLNRLVKITDPLGGLTQFGYDANGNLLSVTDARNSVTGYTYNTMDRLATRTDPLLRAESYAYDNAGNLGTFTDRKSQVTNVTYDALNRFTQVNYQDGSTTSYTWDGGNRPTQVVDSISGTITRGYDNLDRLTSETTPQGSVSYTYDAAGRRTSMTVAGQPPVSYTYDNANRLTQITQGSATVTLGYDAAGRRTSLTLPNGISTEYAYDAASRLTGLTYKQGATTIGSLTYSYDAAGNRTQVGGTWARTGLPQAVASATYDAANQQLAFGGQTLTYDANGNLTSDGTNTYTWNARDQLVAINGASVTASFSYDGLGRRRTKTINSTGTDFLYDGLNPVQELNGATVLANILPGLGIDEYFTRTDSAGTRALLTDALGSTVALTDPAGAVQTQYTYEGFGATTVAGPTSTNSFQYTGREQDGPIGFYFLRARYYSPTLHRFISQDPIGFLGGDVNLYAYVQNRPTRFVDPWGLLTRNPNRRRVFIVKPQTEETPIGYLPPGYEWPGNPDGVKVPGEPWWKIPIPDTIWPTNIPWPDVPIDIGPDGKPVCKGFPCNLPFNDPWGRPFYPHQPPDLNDPNKRPDWQLPPELGPLPGIRPIQPGRKDPDPFLGP